MASSRESDTEIPDFSQPYQASLIDLIVASNRRPRRDRLAQHPIWTEKAVRYVNSLGRCIPLPPEILMRIVRENVEIESGSRCISMCMLLCCRDWCDVAEFMLWRDILLAGNSRVKSFLACVDRSIGSTNQNISRLRSLQVALHPRNTLYARLCGKLSLFQNLRHLSVTITDPNDTSDPFLAKYADFEWRLLLLKLPTTLESLELVARDNDVLDPRTSIFFIIQKAMRHLRSLRIIATDYESQHWQVPLMQPWAETYPLLEQFSILIEHSSDCDEPYCINPDILQGAAYLVDQARRAGQFPKLRVANFSVYESSRRSPKFRVKYLCLIKTASVFDMVRSKVLRYPLLQVRHANSQDGEIIEKTIFLDSVLCEMQRIERACTNRITSRLGTSTAFEEPESGRTLPGNSHWNLARPARRMGRFPVDGLPGHLLQGHSSARARIIPRPLEKIRKHRELCRKHGEGD